MLRTLLLAAAATAIIGSAKAGRFVFSEIHVPGDGNPYVYGINNSNTVVGGFQVPGPTLPQHGFAWADGATTVVAVPGETRQDTFVLVGVNAYGIAAGSFFDPQTGARESFVYDLNTSKATPIVPPIGYVLNAYAMSNTNLIVGVATSLSGGPSTIFTKTLGKRVSLIGPAFSPHQIVNIVPNAVASSGEIVGYASLKPGSKYVAFSYLNGSFTPLVQPAAGNGYPGFVNNHGVVAGEYDATGPHGVVFHYGFVQRGSKLETVAFPASAGMDVVSTTVAGVTRTGDVLGSYSVKTAQTETTTHGFIRHQGVLSSFDVPGAVSTSVTKINEQGSVAGTYTDAQGHSHAFAGVCASDQAPCTQ